MDYNTCNHVSVREQGKSKLNYIQGVCLIDHVKSEVDGEDFCSMEQAKLSAQNFGGVEHIKSEVGDRDSGSIEQAKSKSNIQNFGDMEQITSNIDDEDFGKSRHLGLEWKIENFDGLKHLNVEKLSGWNFDSSADEKPCIKALKSSLAAHTVNEEELKVKVELSSDAGKSSHDFTESHDKASSNAEKTSDQECVTVCPPAGKAIECSTMESMNKVRRSGSRKPPSCLEMVTKLTFEDVEKKETVATEVSQGLRRTRYQGKSSQYGRFQCLWCPYVYFQSAERERHMKASHKEEYARISQEEQYHSTMGQHQGTTTSSDLVEISSSSHTGNQLGHDAQSKKFAPNSTYTHRKTYPGERPFKCGSCDKTFEYKHSLVNHEENHCPTVEKSYKCDLCGKGFVARYFLSVHVKIHTGEKPFKCGVCGKGFGKKSDLSRHEITHTGEKPYKCDVCGRAYGRFGSLVVHKKAHTGEGLYTCDVCGRGFGQRSGLLVHRMIHTGERPYGCNVCGRAFQTVSSLNQHQKKHWPAAAQRTYKYKCDECGRAFGRTGDLLSHLRTHTGERPYMCGVCGKGYRQSSALSVHEKTHSGPATPKMWSVW